MKKLITAAFAATALSTATAGTIVAAAGDPATARPIPGRGSIVSTTHVQHLDANQVRAALTTDRFDTGRVRHGVDAYRIVYRTVDVRHRPTTASGLVVLPRDGQRRLRAVSYAHGTMAGRDEAPSVDSGGRSDEGLAIASAGYAAVEPDYLGLGVGPGAHPYLDLASEVTAQVDMLSAARSLAARVRRPLDGRLLVTGFSQGGDAAMALGKALQHREARPFRLAGDAPISGPYDLLGQELPAAFDGRLDPGASAYYLAYVTTSFQRRYHLYDRTSDVFATPYDRTVAPLYDGEHDDEQIFAALPPSPAELFTPAWLAQLKHPAGRLRATLRADDTACRGWAPARIHFYAARGDEQVAVGDTDSCRAQLSSDGVASERTDTGDVGHFASGRRGLAGAIRWFEQIAPAEGQSPTTR